MLGGCRILVKVNVRDNGHLYDILTRWLTAFVPKMIALFKITAYIYYISSLPYATVCTKI